MNQSVHRLSLGRGYHALILVPTFFTGDSAGNGAAGSENGEGSCGGVMGNTAQDLYPVLQHILHDLKADAHARQIEIIVADDAMLASHLDADAFGILIRNLIENDIKHGTAGTTVDITFPAHRQIRIVNDCARIEASDLNTLRDRFRRGTTTAQGSGIGLAIADAIISGTGGHLELRSPATGRTDEFEVVVDLPA